MSNIYEDFWRGTNENRVYFALYKIFDRVTRIKPVCHFDLPLIGHKLKECSSNRSEYPHWGKGKGHFYDEFYCIFTRIFIL